VGKQQCSRKHHHLWFIFLYGVIWSWLYDSLLGRLATRNCTNTIISSALCDSPYAHSQQRKDNKLSLSLKVKEFYSWYSAFGKSLCT
jgi:hypothetical protein